MELELKHLAGYLPYGLTGVRQGYGKMGVNYIYHPAYDNTPTMIENPIKGISSSGSLIANYNNFKPILRPLSDLTKEIEVSGERFVPNGLLFPSNNIREVKENYIINKLGYSFLVIDLPFKQINKLLEWHFDIYGLIENGLAIDINTLK